MPGATINGDAFVARVNRTGTNLLFFTFLGGSGDDGALDLALDSAGNAYITGFTDSTNFPSVPAGGVPGLRNSTNISGTITPAHVFFTDAFVAELTSDGSGLIFSSYLGGSDRDMGIGIAVDATEFHLCDRLHLLDQFPDHQCAGSPAAALCEGVDVYQPLREQ